MQENEKYGIELEAKTGLFKKGMQELSKMVKDFGKEAEKNTTIAPEIDLNELYKWREETQKLLQQERENKKFNLGGGSEGIYDKNIKWYEDVLDAINTRINELNGNEEELNDELEETNETANKTSFSLSSLFDKSIGKIKRFTYYLLGARSVFSLFMRYRSIYYQYNEEMQYQSELSQNAIALSLAPAFEFLGNVITYTSIGIAKFIELLTGVNILSKVTTKGIRDYNKSLKETQTLVSGIDEITNLTNPQGLGLASQYQALADFQKKVAEVEKFFNENKWITDLAEGLRKVWNFINEKIIPILSNMIEGVGGVQNALILLGGYKVMSSLGRLLGTAGGIAGAGASGLLGILAVCGLVSMSLLEISRENTNKPFEENLKNLRTYASEFHKNMTSDEYQDVLKKINKELGSVQAKIKKQPEEYAKVKDELDDVFDLLTDITGIDYKIELQHDPAEEEGFFNGIKVGFKTMINGFKDALGVGEMDKSWEHFEQKGKESINNITDKILGLPTQISNSITNITDKINKITKTNYVIKFTTSIVSKIGEGATATANALSQAIVKSIRGYAKGLDYVPYDNYPALLHKGEAVVPAKYNPSIHSEGNDYTNSLLETLILKVDDLASRPNVFEIDGQQFANATYGLYDNERKRQGYVEGVVR